MPLSDNQVTDLFTQQFGRAPKDYELQQYNTSNLDQFSTMSDPTYALVTDKTSGAGTVYNKRTNTAFSTPQQFAQDAGIDPNNIAWDKLRLDKGFNPSAQPYSLPDPTANEKPLDSQDAYNNAFSGLGGDTAKQNMTNVQSQVNAIDDTLNNLLLSKKQQVEQSGGIVSDAQLQAEVAQEKQPLLLQRESLVNQLKLAQNQYNDVLKQANTEAQLAVKDSNDKIAGQKVAVQAANDLMKEISSGALDPSTLDPAQLAQLERSAGFPAGTLSKIVSSQKFVAHSFITDDKGNTTFVGVNQNGQVTTQKLGGIGKSKTASKKSSSTASVVSGDPTTIANVISNTKDPNAPIPSLGGLSAHGLEQAAKVYMTENEKMPSLGLGQNADVKAARQAIINYAGYLADQLGTDIPTISALYKSNAKAMSDNIGRMARIETVSKALSAQFPRIMQLADKVGNLGITEADLTAGKAATARKFGSVDAGNYVELIQTIRGDYAAMQAALSGSRGGQFFSAGAQDAIPIGLTSDQYAGIQQTIETSAQNSAAAVKDETQSLISGTPGATPPPDSGSQQPDANLSDEQAYQLYLKTAGGK